jgi:hypothetical protein
MNVTVHESPDIVLGRIMKQAGSCPRELRVMKNWMYGREGVITPPDSRSRWQACQRGLLPYQHPFRTRADEDHLCSWR